MSHLDPSWKDHVVWPDKVLEEIEPGMRIYLGTGAAEPRTLIKHLMASEASNLQDLELLQIVSLGDALSPAALQSHKYRLKTFYSGWVASEAITAGWADLIPTRFARIPELLKRGRIPVDVAMIQVSVPNSSGFCSLGIAVDAARAAMQQASLVVGEMNPAMPETAGDTLVPINDFDLLVEATEEPIYMPRWPVEPVFEELAEKVTSVIEDGRCLGFSVGPLYEALAQSLRGRRELGIHSAFVTDAVMELVTSGAVTNRHKVVFRGRSTASYAMGTADLLSWIHRNPLVEFEGVDKVFDPVLIGRNPGHTAVYPARKVDLAGRIALHVGKGMVAASPAETLDFVRGAEISPGGLTIFALPSRNREGQSNVRLSVNDFPNEFSLPELVDFVVTEHGTAALRGRSIRERAQLLIDIAHPDDREALVEAAREANILYADQVFLAASGQFYPEEIASEHAFGEDLTVRFRAIRPSDEEGMRRLFYRFSKAAVYYRYFSPISTMPHRKMQSYVNVDHRTTLSLVGLEGEPGAGTLMAEARYVQHQDKPWGDIAFVVDEDYQGRGIASHLLTRLITLGKERGLVGFTADVLATNKPMLHILEKSGLYMKATVDSGCYEIRLYFEEPTSP